MTLVVVGHRTAASLLDRQTRCVLSSACTELFSSTLNTTAFSGGFRYSPTTSCSFSSNRGSLLTLKVRTRCGFKPCDCHTRWTKLCVVPIARAIVRVDQCVASFGVVCVVASIIRARSFACRSESLPP